MSFYDQIQKTIANSDSNRSVTENGAIGCKTTGRKLLDLNFAVSSLRSKTDGDIERMFSDALGENFNTAIVWLFFARDIRGSGMGERRLFRVCMRYLAREFPDTVRKLLPLIAEYGRWDDLVCLADAKRLEKDVVNIIKTQLANDMEGMKAGKSISLLSKWLPSANTSSQETRRKAGIIWHALNITPRQYRKVLSALRRHIDVTERKMSANKWGEIKYEAVPSRANLNYNSAFLRHDEERRREYLGKLEKGETKINSSVLFPHDIVHKYKCGYGTKEKDAALEAMWKALPNTVKDGEGTIVVADGSGSMYSPVGNTKVYAWEVAHALAIYFAERLPSPYKDQYITFSTHPQLVQLGGAGSLREKLRIADEHDECSNTNIEAVFDLILATAIDHHLSQNELPNNILIISDLEFDSCATTNEYSRNRWVAHRPNNTLFGEIASRYAAHGYQLPRLVFWNVNSRTGTIPIKENDLGVALVSGFSPNVAKMVMSGKLDPYEALLDSLNVPRYDAVREALAKT